MSVNVEFHFDFGSPNAYLAHRVIPEIEARTGECFRYVPVLLGGVFKATNNASPMVTLKGVKNKPDYARIEMERFVSRHELAEVYRFNPHFPVNTLQIMRGAVAMQRRDSDVYARYVRVVYDAMWCSPAKMDDPDVILEVLTAGDLPADEIVAAMQDPKVKSQLIANTEESVARGVFGSPSFFVGDELYFGKDKLRDVEEEIEAQKRGTG